MVNQKTLLTITEAAQFLNLKRSRLYQMVFKQEIPFVKIGTSLRFDASDLSKWIEHKKCGLKVGDSNE